MKGEESHKVLYCVAYRLTPYISLVFLFQADFTGRLNYSSKLTFTVLKFAVFLLSVLPRPVKEIK